MSQQKKATLQKLSWKKKLVFFSLTFLVLFALLEIGLRVVFAARVGPSVLFYGTRLARANKIRPQKDATSVPQWSPEWRPTVTDHKNESAGYTKYFPNQVRTDVDVEKGEMFMVHINSRGFRGSEFQTEKEPGVIRVVTLGASSTFGFHNRDDDTYPYYMQQILDQEGNGKRFEVINLGIPHLVSNEILSLFMSEGVQLDPDIVTFYEGNNDSGGTTRKLQTEVTQRLELKAKPKGFRQRITRPLKNIPGLHDSFTAIRDHIITIAFFHSLATNLLEKVDYDRVIGYSTQEIDEHRVGKIENFMYNMNRILEECRKREIVFIVANQQKKSYALDRDEIKGVSYQEEMALVEENLAEQGYLSKQEVHFLIHGTLMKQLEDWAISNDIPFVDVIKELDQDRDVLLTHVHLSPKGNRIAAEAFVNEILKQVESMESL